MKFLDTANGWAFISASAYKHSVNDVIGGVGTLLNPRAPKSLNSIAQMQPKMMVATFNRNPCTTIISCYSSSHASDETNLITFYNELSSFVVSIPKHNVLIIGGDMNTQIDKNENSEFCLHNSLNRNGEHLTESSLENGLTCLNSKFQKRRENY